MEEYTSAFEAMSLDATAPALAAGAGHLSASHLNLSRFWPLNR